MERIGLSCSRETFSAVISAYANVGDLDQTKAWCKRGEDAGFVPTVAEYTHLLKACGQTQDKPADPVEGKHIFLTQIAKGIAPNNANLQALADALGATASQRLCEELHVHTRACRLNWWPDPRHF